MHHRPVSTHAFNLVEIMLAMVVIGVGLLAIIGLIPIGLRANQNAVSKNYSADAADQMLGFFANYLREDWTRVTNNAVLPDETPTAINDLNSPASVDAATDFSTPTAGNYLFDITGKDGVYRLTTRTDASNAETYTDFDAVARLWKTPTEGWSRTAGNWVKEVDTTYESRVQVNLELSYPASLPYRARKKVLYTLEVSRLD